MSTNDKLMINGVISQVLIEERTHQGLQAHSALAAMTSSVKLKLKGKGKDKSKIKCYKCKEVGHMKDKCPQKASGKGKASSDGKEDKEKSGDKGNLTAKVAQVQEVREQSLQLFMAQKGPVMSPTEWVVDLGSWNHQNQ
ncbi:hypothetical protein PISMIDRAFT_10349 [Pisolithus microcarpus 441]|uniref:CCHC-type domain-containing protein n=1 Tax=Pisolithus microcarpus 441 TaxID=765257 RepID=A0A0C9ZPE8_9AGAM|nr:hypothetical protein PISMIDRAFT_10349 [Pisolithus microcarpus 441]